MARVLLNGDLGFLARYDFNGKNSRLRNAIGSIADHRVAMSSACKTAKALGLEVPTPVLARPDAVIE